jgi:hypothetical protein
LLEDVPCQLVRLGLQAGDAKLSDEIRKDAFDHPKGSNTLNVSECLEILARHCKLRTGGDRRPTPPTNAARVDQHVRRDDLQRLRQRTEKRRNMTRGGTRKRARPATDNMTGVAAMPVRALAGGFRFNGCERSAIYLLG